MSKRQKFIEAAVENQETSYTDPVLAQAEERKKEIDAVLKAAHEEEAEKEVETEAEVDVAESIIEEKAKADSVSSVVDIEALKNRVSDSGKIVVLGIVDFMKQAGPAVSHTEENGGRLFTRFWGVLKTLFNNVSDDDFKIIYRELLNLFNEHKDGIFKDERMYRFNEFWTMSDGERAAFRRLVNLMLVTRDPAVRHKSVEQLRDWNYILEHGLTEAAKIRIRNFYEI